MAFFTFGSSPVVSYEATSISVTTSGREVDASHLGLSKGSLKKFRSLKMTNYEIKVDYIGDTAPAIGVDDFGIDSGWGAAGSSMGTKAACTSVTITGTVGDQVKGSATFKPSYD